MEWPRPRTRDVVGAYAGSTGHCTINLCSYLSAFWPVYICSSLHLQGLTSLSPFSLSRYLSLLPYISLPFCHHLPCSLPSLSPLFLGLGVSLFITGCLSICPFLSVSLYLFGCLCLSPPVHLSLTLSLVVNLSPCVSSFVCRFLQPPSCLVRHCHQIGL